MTVGSMIVKRDPPMTCSRCKHEIPKGATAWYTKGKRGYWCQACQDDWLASNKGAYQTETTTTTTAAQTTPEAARQSSIEQAHKDNMESARQTRDAICLLVTALSNITELSKAVNGLEKELSVLVTVLREGTVKEGKA